MLSRPTSAAVKRPRTLWKRSRLPRSVAEKKKPEDRGQRVAKQHTAGLGNVEEGRLADKAKTVVKKRQRKRPTLGSQYKNLN